MSLRSDIDKELKKLDIDKARLCLVNITRWKNIEKRIAASLLERGVRDSKCRWWWSHFKSPVISSMPYYVPDELLKIVPNNEKIYFIAEGSGDKFWLYEGYIKEVCQLVGEMYGFEYYIVSKKMEWIMSENHHQVLIASGQKMVSKISELKNA